MSYVYDPEVNYELTHGNPASWIAIVWNALDGTSEVDKNRNEDDEWDEVCTAMAWIQAEIGVGNITDFPEGSRDVPDSPSLEDDAYYGTLIDIQNHELGGR